MKIEELRNYSDDWIYNQLLRGGRYVVYTYAISIIVMTYRRGSDVYFLKAGEPAIKHGWKYLLISILFGWWGFPYGPIYTIQSIWYAFVGKNVTRDIIDG